MLTFHVRTRAASPIPPRAARGARVRADSHPARRPRPRPFICTSSSSYHLGHAGTAFKLHLSRSPPPSPPLPSRPPSPAPPSHIRAGHAQARSVAMRGMARSVTRSDYLPQLCDSLQLVRTCVLVNERVTAGAAACVLSSQHKLSMQSDMSRKKPFLGEYRNIRRWSSDAFQIQISQLRV